MKMNDGIFNLFTILHPNKKQKYPSSSKLCSKKKNNNKICHSVLLVWKQSVKKASQINLLAFVWISFISVDTQFCTHNLIKENDLNDHPCTSKIKISLRVSIFSCITWINASLHALIYSLHIIKMILRFQWSQQCFPVIKSDY